MASIAADGALLAYAEGVYDFLEPVSHEEVRGASLGTPDRKRPCAQQGLAKHVLLSTSWSHGTEVASRERRSGQAANARGCWRVARHRSGQDDHARLLSGQASTGSASVWEQCSCISGRHTLSLWSGSRDARSRGGPRLRRRRPAAQRAMPTSLEWRDAATESAGVPFADRWRQWKGFLFEDWSLYRPRTTRCLLNFKERFGGGPLGWHAKLVIVGNEPACAGSRDAVGSDGARRVIRSARLPELDEFRVLVAPIPGNRRTFRQHEAERAIEGIGHFMRRPRLAGGMAMYSLPSGYVAERVAQATALSIVAVMAREARAAQDVPQVVGESVEMVQTNSQARVDD